MCSEPKNYATLCRIAAIAIWVVCWFFDYSEVITTIWVATNWVASIVCDAAQLIYDRLPLEDPPEQPQRERPRRERRSPLRHLMTPRRAGERGH